MYKYIYICTCYIIIHIGTITISGRGATTRYWATYIHISITYMYEIMLYIYIYTNICMYTFVNHLLRTLCIHMIHTHTHLYMMCLHMRYSVSMQSSNLSTQIWHHSIYIQTCVHTHISYISICLLKYEIIHASSVVNVKPFCCTLIITLPVHKRHSTWMIAWKYPQSLSFQTQILWL